MSERTKGSVRIPVTEAEKIKFQIWCKERRISETEEAKRIIDLGLKDLDAEMSATGSITLTIKKSVLPAIEYSECHFIQIFNLGDNLARITAYAKFLGMTNPNLCRYLIRPTLEKI